MVQMLKYIDVVALFKVSPSTASATTGYGKSTRAYVLQEEHEG